MQRGVQRHDRKLSSRGIKMRVRAKARASQKRRRMSPSIIELSVKAQGKRPAK